MKRDLFVVSLIWLALTIAGELVVWLWIRGIMPARYAETATIVDDAFLYLTTLAVPVFSFVIAMVVVSLLRHHTKGEPQEDGPRSTGTSGSSPAGSPSPAHSRSR